MAAGICDRLLSMSDLAEMIDAALPKPGKRGPYKSARHRHCVMQELRYWAVASLVLIGLWIAFALWVSATISSNEPPEAVVFVNPGPVLVLAIWTAYFGLAVVIRVLFLIVKIAKLAATRMVRNSN
jgi:hypothetical protein